MFRGRVRRVHFIGVGGIGMSGLAEILRTMEFEVTGSDLKLNDVSRRLQTLGVLVQEGHRPENVDGADVSSDPVSGDVYALRGDGFASVQGHLESILSRDGMRTLERLIAAALGAPTA